MHAHCLSRNFFWRSNLVVKFSYMEISRSRSKASQRLHVYTVRGYASPIDNSGINNFGDNHWSACRARNITHVHQSGTSNLPWSLACSCCTYALLKPYSQGHGQLNTYVTSIVTHPRFSCTRNSFLSAI